MAARMLWSGLIAAVLAAPAAAWDAAGHRMITYLALDGLPADAPAWLREPNVRHRIAYQSSEPDRWRGSRIIYLAHENSPEHYLDVEELAMFGLTLDTLPNLRAEYLRAMIISKHEHPELVTKEFDPEKNPPRDKEWPGFLPHAICEHYSKLSSSFATLRTLEKIGDPNRAFQVEQARENIIYHMGILSHFVGDAAQPLHTTMHFNGWAGPNPEGYTTAKSFHSFIDGGLIEKFGLTVADLRPGMKYELKVELRDPWADTIRYIGASHRLVEPLYRLDRDKRLTESEGRELITGQLRTAGAMLAAYYGAAYKAGVVDDKAIEDFKRFDNLKPEQLPGATSQPASQPETANAG